MENPRKTVGGTHLGAGCATCAHPDVAAINALVNEGRWSSRQIARRYGLSKDTVARHAFKRHPGVRGTEPARPPVGDDERGEVERLRDIRASLETEMARAPRADLSRELRQVNERIAHLEGTDRPVEASLSDVRGLAEQVRRWFEALEPYPDAREAMFAATDPELLGAAGLGGDGG